ncbi:alkylated DNA repair dioxygenase AlkB [Filimonas zeae]|uniref:Alpha-ketoglutarate-dependent dioxygenase AlkB n=1 Tax=Filimonas zeae TaxID=1737353 RepID=A0A917MUE0_9BACT|nr:alpha-ketoglutarate-dependent dioxygenase AlkB [Filimonas zeae]MDR6339254.1 alkylated DNA repair dioxygenase AlkB [Filimonas zeae]GGH64418.1 alpha-ketoglutarate-dependent dioxygenase AlkB [Filimonas zeae]
MLLFDDVALFDEGKKRYTDFNLPGAELRLWEQFYDKAASDHYYRLLETTTPWQQRERKIYDRIVPDPRLTAYYGGANGNAWTKPLLEIKEQVEQTSRIQFDRVLLNYYRDGNDSVAWHSDTLPKDGKHHEIASVTFGATRLFKVRHKTDKTVQQLNIPLTHGSFLLMGASLQNHYEHQVPKTTKATGGRINLTFRISESSKPVYVVEKR